MGLDLKRSDTPGYIQDFLSDILNKVLTGKQEQEVMEFIADFRLEFRILNYPIKCFFVSMSQSFARGRIVHPMDSGGITLDLCLKHLHFSFVFQLPIALNSFFIITLGLRFHTSYSLLLHIYKSIH